MAEYPNIAATAFATPPSGQNGAIGGSVLRPGSIDQGEFQKQLRAQYQLQNQGKDAAIPTGLTLADYRRLAGAPATGNAAAGNMATGNAVPGNALPGNALPGNPAPAVAPAASAVPQAAPLTGPESPPVDNIPTLSLEQFAALTGISPPPAVPPTAAEAPEPVELMTGSSDAVEVADAPQDLADGVPVLESVPELAPAETRQKDSRVVLLDTYPDREQQRSIAAQGKTWRMNETPGARELFLGPDGEFGWDDFVDIINPLQHIPVVAQVYRAVTGDQAYGLSAFAGALPFGPISVASAIVDTIVRSQTGRDAGTDLAASILGVDNRTAEEADLNLGRTANNQFASVDSGTGNSGIGNSGTGDPGTGDSGTGGASQMGDAINARYPLAATSWSRDMSGGRG